MPTGDTASASGQALGSGEMDEYELSQPGADGFSGIVERATTSVAVYAVWLDGDRNDIIEEQIASAGAGSQATWDVPPRNQQVRLEIRDDGAGSGEYSMSAHFR